MLPSGSCTVDDFFDLDELQQEQFALWLVLPFSVVPAVFLFGSCALRSFIVNAFLRSDVIV